MNKHTVMRKSGLLATAVLCGAMAVSALPGQAVTADTVVAQAPGTKGGFGPVTNLAATPTATDPGYRIDATWSPLAGAAKYNVSLLGAGGTVLSQGTVTSTAWSVSTQEKAGQQLAIKVVGVNNRNKKSKPATVAVNLPDVTAPHATYRVSSEGGTGTITQVTLSDDVSTSAQITRRVNWGGGFVDWQAGESVSHEFAATGMYHPEVKVTDQAGNSRTYVLNLPIGDEEAPSGTYQANPGNVWVKPAGQVTLTQLTLADEFSAKADIARLVIWGDDSAPESWTTGDTITHTYTTAGTYTPVVQLTDEAGNVTNVDASTIVAASDEVAPTSAVSRPTKAAKRASKWRTVRGSATDVAGTGVEVVSIRAVQKRGQAWYAYNALKAKWVKAGSAKASAVRKSRPAEVATTELDTWSYKFGSMRKGKLLLKVQSSDRAGNVSQPVKVSQKLTRR